MGLGPQLRPSMAPSSPSAGGPLGPAAMSLVHEQEEHQPGDGAFPPPPRAPREQQLGARSTQLTKHPATAAGAEAGHK